MIAAVNVHHLELFYYVAKHGGISEAARKMPYGIQQPAVSGQMLKLEEHLGLRLFTRRPFQLTPAGAELMAFVEPFFSRIGDVSASLRGELAQRLRLAAPTTILRDHFPEIFERLRKRFPRISLTLHDTDQADAETLLRRGDIDLAVTEMHGSPLAGLQSCVLAKVPPVLLVPASGRAASARQLFSKGEISEPLVSLPASAALSKLFQSHLAALGVSWPPQVEVSSLTLVASYVARGFGAGVSLRMPGTALPAGVRTVPLPGCPPLVVAALWREKLSPLAAAFLAEVEKRAAQLR